MIQGGFNRMNKIVKIEGSNVLIGMDDMDIVTVPIANINYDNPQIGDIVDVFKNEDRTIVVKSGNNNADSGSNASANISGTPSNNQSMYVAREKHINKHIFVWIGTFLFPGFGVDRFMRGQIGLGILKILTAAGLGIWALVDFIIALVKVYGNAFGHDDEVVFINGKYAR
jgi:TM2 domain-containing membrane protein YozV